MSEPESAQDKSQPQSQNAASSQHDSSAGSISSSRASKMGRGRSSLRRLSSSIFTAARQSFFKNRGQSGASVETLRGNTGADFEGYATVNRGEDTLSLCSCLGKEKGGLHFLLIKGYHCFVFNDEAGKSPKYAIELINRTATVQPSHESHIPHFPHPGADKDTTYTTIHLETGLGDIEYKFTFANMEDGLAAKFCNAVSAASNEAATEQVRKRLGHGGLLDKRASLRYANAVGDEKTKQQPDAPVGAGEVLATMPSPAY